MTGFNLEILRKVPEQFGMLGSEVPGYEAERAYAYPEPVEKERVINLILGALVANNTWLGVLPFLIEKQMLVWKYEGSGKKVTINRNLHDGSTTVVAKGKKELFRGTNGEDGLVVMRRETKVLVPDGRNPLEVARREVSLDECREMNLVSQYLREKITGVVLDENGRAYLINLDERQRPEGDEPVPGQLEVEYYGRVPEFTAGNSNLRQDVCNGVLALSNRVSYVCEELGYPLTPKDQSKRVWLSN